MRIAFIFLFLLSPILNFGQEEPQAKVNTFQLGVGDVLDLGNISLNFKNVVSDSRCPKDVTCIWAGEAVVSIEVYENGKCIEEKLITVNSSHISLEFPGGDFLYKITGISLSPLPTVKGKNIPAEYRLNLRVSETLKG